MLHVAYIASWLYLCQRSPFVARNANSISADLILSSLSSAYPSPSSCKRTLARALVTRTVQSQHHSIPSAVLEKGAESTLHSDRISQPTPLPKSPCAHVLKYPSPCLQHTLNNRNNRNTNTPDSLARPCDVREAPLYRCCCIRSHRPPEFTVRCVYGLVVYCSTVSLRPALGGSHLLPTPPKPHPVHKNM